MSIKENVFANYVGQIYVAIIGLVMVPFYMRQLGIEAYGLIGFHAMLQTFLQALDLGLSPSLGREVARFRAGAVDAHGLRSLLRSIEVFFAVIGLTISTVIFVSSGWISTAWLRVTYLDHVVVASSVSIMGGIAATRWLSGLYRGGIIGLERQVWLNGANIAIATVRYVGVTAILLWVSRSPMAFFLYQLLIALLEAIILRIFFYRYLPKPVKPVVFSWRAFRNIMPFAGSLAFISSVWVLMTQIDKFVLSRFLSLAEYGYFTLAVTAASGLNLLIGPISQAILPRLTVLATKHQEEELRLLYRTATQFIAVIVVSLAGLIAIFAEPLLYAWTGNADAAQHAAPILFWYSLGNAALALAAMQYFLQYAYGNVRLLVLGSILFAVILLPTIIFMTTTYGAIGAAVTWFGLNLFFLFCWVPVVHRRLAPGLHPVWMFKDIVPIGAVGGIVLAIISHASIETNSRWRIISILILFGIAALCLNISIAPLCRASLMNYKK